MNAALHEFTHSDDLICFTIRSDHLGLTDFKKLQNFYSLSSLSHVEQLPHTLAEIRSKNIFKKLPFQNFASETHELS